MQDQSELAEVIDDPVKRHAAMEPERRPAVTSEHTLCQNAHQANAHAMLEVGKARSDEHQRDLFGRLDDWPAQEFIADLSSMFLEDEGIS